MSTGGTVDGSPLADIDAAIKAVDDQRSLLGASQNRFGVHHHQPEQHREQPVGSPQPYSGLRLRDGSVEHVARADPATGRFLGTGTGQLSSADHAVPAALIIDYVALSAKKRRLSALFYFAGK